MEDRKNYLWRVSHPIHGEIEVEAQDRYSAVLKAAHDWGLRWSTIARDCRTEQLNEVTGKKNRSTSPSAPRNDRKKGGSKGGKTDEKKQRDH